MAHRKICRRRFNAVSVIFGDIRNTLPADVSHEEGTTIYIQIRTQLSYCGLVNLKWIQRATYGLRNAKTHGLALGLLGQRLFRTFGMLALREVARDSLNTNRLSVAANQTRTNFESNTTSLL